MISDAIATAIKMETDAMAFYEEAAGKTTHPFGKEMFKGFVKDERRHLQILQSIRKGLDIRDEFVRPRETIRTVFSELKDEMMKRVEAAQDEMDAVRIALQFEKAGYDFYVKAAQAAASPREKELLERLAAEENDHYAILNETHTFLEDTGQWFMYEERGMLEG